MNRRIPNLSIKTKTTGFVVLTLGVLVALMATVQFRSSLERVEQIEKNQAIESSDRVVRQLDNSLVDIGGTNTDWAWWDDVYEFIQDGNQEFRDANLYASAFTPLGIDLIAFVDTTGTVIHQSWYVEDDEVAVPSALLSQIEPGSPLGDFAEDPNATPSGIVEADGEVFLVTSRAILRSNEAGEPAGVLLMARQVNNSFASELSDLVNLDLVVQPCNENTCNGLSAQPTITTSSANVSSQAAVNDPDGQPVLHIDVTSPRTMYQESLAGIQRVLLILIAVGIGAIVVTVAGLRMLIIDPLGRLGSTVAEVARTNDPSLRAPIERSDEIGDLAAGVNVMLARLENSQNQLIEAKEQVEGSSEAKSRFLSRVSHEVRTPINGVLAYAQLLQLDHPDGESREFIDQIITSARHITSLVDEFLDIARIEAGAIPMHLDHINPTTIAAEVVDMTRPLATTQGAVVEVSGPDQCLVLADPLRLRQSILNLVSNAIKYGTGDQPIAVSVQPDGPRTVIAVSDHGPGIPADQLHRLFIPFDRLTADSSDKAGSGVGLTVTKQLVELMDGTIEVTSQVGSGTTFTIIIPTATESEPSNGSDHREHAVSASSLTD